jgi:hypothetical protein
MHPEPCSYPSVDAGSTCSTCPGSSWPYHTGRSPRLSLEGLWCHHKKPNHSGGLQQIYHQGLGGFLVLSAPRTQRPASKCAWHPDPALELWGHKAVSLHGTKDMKTARKDPSVSQPQILGLVETSGSQVLTWLWAHVRQTGAATTAALKKAKHFRCKANFNTQHQKEKKKIQAPKWLSERTKLSMALRESAQISFK